MRSILFLSTFYRWRKEHKEVKYLLKFTELEFEMKQFGFRYSFYLSIRHKRKEREHICMYSNSVFLFFSFFFLMFTYFWETERDRSWAGQGRREREMQNLKQVPGSELSAQSPAWGLNLWTMRSWPEQKSDAQPTEPPRCSQCFHFLIRNKYWVQFHNLLIRIFTEKEESFHIFLTYWGKKNINT